jgi:integrase
MSITADKKDGKLTGRFRVEVQLAGQRLRGRFNSMEEAKKAEAAMKRQLLSGDTEGATARDDLRSDPRTLSQLLAKAAPMLWNGSEHGLVCDRKIRTIIEEVGDPTLADLDTRYVDTVMAWLREGAKSPATVNRYLSALHAVLKWGAAKGRRYVPELPEFQWEVEDEGRTRSISPAEEAELIRHLKSFGRDDVAAFVQVAIDTGCRRSELLNSSKADLDSNEVTGHGWLRLWGDRTKTGRSRSVPLTDRAKALLEAYLPWSFSEDALRRSWERAKAAMGLTLDEHFVLHACRHTCATRLVERGVNLRIVQTYMGHRAIKTTLRYAHVNDDMLARAAQTLVVGGGARRVGDEGQVREDEVGDGGREPAETVVTQ